MMNHSFPNRPQAAWCLALCVSALGFASCADSHSGPDLCMTADGHALAAGEHVRGDRCRVCDAHTATVMPVWGDGCGTSTDRRYSPTMDGLGGDQLKVSPDMNGDGMKQLVVSLYLFAERIPGGEPTAGGRMVIYDLPSGDFVQVIDGTEEHPFGGAQDVGADVDGDGLADLIWVESAGRLAGAMDRNGGPADSDDRPNIVHVRSLMHEDDLWTVTGPGGCHALGATGALFVPDYDGDAVADVAIVDPGCITAEVPQLRGNLPGGDRTGSLRLHSGADGHLIRMWSSPPAPVDPEGHVDSVWGGAFNSTGAELHLVPDRDGDGKPEIAVGSDFFSVLQDEPIARLLDLPADVPAGQMMLGTDLTGDGDINLVRGRGRNDGTIELTIFGHLLDAEQTSQTVEFRIPGGSRSVHEVLIYGSSDVDGDGQPEILFLNTDHESELTLRGANLVAVSLSGSVVWQSSVDAFPLNIVNGILDLDGDGRDDFVTARLGPILHIDFSSGSMTEAP